MLIKMGGAVLIILSTSLMGFSLAAKYRKRIKELRLLQIAFQMLSSEISYTQTPLPFALREIGRKLSEPVSRFFLEGARLLGECRGKGLEEIWTEAVNKVFPGTCLTDKDRDLLLSVSSFLGISDQYHQEKQIILLLNHLKLSEKEAWESLQKNERMWKYLGVLGGLMLVILLF
ncbi:MAG: stage III sporulation protein AB [Firmicutes bacterium HGW-Firmicutes-13]|nr:MAG: stage III sporulation protein AB [Firmicutes bacterium HGW-Firmicutes-13]